MARASPMARVAVVEAVGARLRGQASLSMATFRWMSAFLARGEAEFPVVVRPVGSHAGRGLVRLDAAAAIADYLATQSGSEFYVSPFVDYGSADGLFRKYRIVFIEGRPFAVHMAVSSHWMVHYLNAEMGESEAKRAEEARFMAEFDGDFARRHAAPLQAMVERVGLDYFGIDCAETPDGELLTFEVDSALVVHAMDPVDTYPYKPPQMHKLFEAFRDMLKRRAAAGQA